MNLPKTILYSMQPYTNGATLGDLHLETERRRDNNGGTRAIVILRGTVIEGTESAYLFGHRSTKSIAGKAVTVYGITQAELDRGHIVRVAM